MTFSIVAWDPTPASGPEWGVAVASKFLAVGAAVPWARAGAGAVATQALANLAYGPDGLGLLSDGRPAQEVVDSLVEADSQRAHRQLGIVDASGRAATFTGDDCLHWAGGTPGEGFCCQGNILVGPEVVDGMADAFAGASGRLAERLLAALRAGDDAGGDSRGRQSAALLVVREGGGYGGGTDRAVDLRVDDHVDPVAELHRLYALHTLIFPAPETLEFVDVDDTLAAEIRSLLGGLGRAVEPTGGYDDELKGALWAYVGTENLEERWTDEARIERGILEYLRSASA